MAYDLAYGPGSETQVYLEILQSLVEATVLGYMPEYFGVWFSLNFFLMVHQRQEWHDSVQDFCRCVRALQSTSMHQSAKSE